MPYKKIKKRQDCIIKQIVQFGLYIEQMEEETHEELERQIDIITDLTEKIEKLENDLIQEKSINKEYSESINKELLELKQKSCGVE